jgi:Na+-driven multidrug efflux pump
VAAYLLIVLITCLTTGMVALFCSVCFRRTSISLMMSYLTLLVLFLAPIAASYFTDTFFAGSQEARYVRMTTIGSPFAAAFNAPLRVDNPTPKRETGSEPEAKILGYRPSEWAMTASFLGFSVCLCVVLLALMIWLFHARWRVSAGRPD